MTTTERLGEPWCLAKRGVDTFVPAPFVNVTNTLLLSTTIEKLDDHYTNHPTQTLVAFFHFSEPDHTGHMKGESSTDYSEVLFELDEALGDIIEVVSASQKLSDTLFYVVTDHGFDAGGYDHHAAPFGILATNDPLVIRGGDRRDLAPTVLDRYAVPTPPAPIPEVDGLSLYATPTITCVAESETYLEYMQPLSLTCCSGLDLVSLDQYNDVWPTSAARCSAATGGENAVAGYCTDCGDNECTPPETVCNCPTDCEEQYAGQGHGGGVQAIECPPGQVKDSLLPQPQTFEGPNWPPAGWMVINNGGDCDFVKNSTAGRPNNTNELGLGSCADADSDYCGPGTTMDTELRTPLLTLPDVEDRHVYLQYRTFYVNYLEEDTAAVDIIVDGGQWTNALEWNEDHSQPATVDLDLTPYVGSANYLKVRWRFQAPGHDWWWQIDDVDVAVCADAEPDIYLTVEEDEGAACPGETVDYQLEVWNDTLVTYTVSLTYTSAWSVSLPPTLSVGASETVPFTASVEVGSTGANTTTITATAGISEAEAQLYTWGHMAFEPGPEVETPRGDLAVVGWGDYVYAIGGTTEGGQPLAVNERLDIASGTWEEMASMPISLTLIDGAAIDGVIYIPGGYDGSRFITATLAYSTEANTWSTKAGAPRAVAGYGVAACGALLYRVGGSILPAWPSAEVPEVWGAEVYDPATDQWAELPAMNHGHVWPGVACYDGKLYVAGGLDETKYGAKTAEYYDIVGDHWYDDEMDDLDINWWGSADFLMGDVLFLAGGYFGGDERGASFYHDLYYDTLTEEWTLGPVLETPRYRAEGDMAFGSGYVMGGWGEIWDAHSSTEVLESCQ